MTPSTSQRAKQRSYASSITLLGVIAAVGCADEHRVLTRLTVDDGSALTSLLRGERTVLLMLSPSDCFTCINHIYSWLEWRRRGDKNRLVIAFERGPTLNEARRLRSLRINDYVVLDPHPELDRLRTPAEYLIANDTIRYSQIIVPRSLRSTLLDRWLNRPGGDLPLRSPVPIPPPTSVAASPIAR